MKPTILSMLLCFGIMGATYGQSFQYLENINTVMPSNNLIIATDPAGNTYVTSTYYYEMTIQGITINSDVYMSTFLAKYDKNGNLKWLKSFESTGQCYPLNVTYNKSTKGVLLCGVYTDVLDVNGVSYPSQGYDDAYWLSVDANGNVLHTTTFGAEGDESIGDIGSDKLGNIYVMGKASGEDELYFNGLLQFTDDIGYTGFIAKYKSDGTPLWMRTISAEINFNIQAMDVASNGTVYFSFTAKGSYYINNGIDESYGIIKPVDDNNVVLFSLTKNGDVYQSTEFYSTNFNVDVTDVVYDGSVNILMNISDSIDVFGDFYYPEIGRGSIIARISFATFEEEWAKYIYSPYGITLNSLKSSGNTMLSAGSYFNYCELDGVSVENPFDDEEGLLITINKNTGVALGVADFDNVESSEYIMDIDADKNGNIYIAGLFNGLIYFDAMNESSEPLHYNLFLTRLNATILKEAEIIPNATFSIYPNPATDVITINEVIQNWEIINAEGQIILSGVGSATTTTINLQTIPSGIYLLSATNTNNQIVTQQFIKQ